MFDPFVTPTKTEKTMADYRKRYRQFDRDAREAATTSRCAEKTSYISDEQAVVNLFLQRRYECMEATERQWRAAIMFVLDEQSQSGNKEAYEAMRKLVGMTKPEDDKFAYFINAGDKKAAVQELEAIRKARKEGQRERRRLGKLGNTSAQKAKSLKGNDITKVFAAVDASRSKWKDDTWVWFQAAMLTGLRPSEWATAALGVDKKGQRVLDVVNGKGSNDRTFGRKRTLVLEGLTPEQMAIVEQQVEKASAMEAGGRFEQWFEACRRQLRDRTKNLWPRRRTRPSLYTARHLFAANAKNSLTRREVAALMGHGSELTAGRHYARAHSATGSMDVSPSEQDIAALIRRNGDQSQAPRTSPWREAQRNRQAVKAGPGI